MLQRFAGPLYIEFEWGEEEIEIFEVLAKACLGTQLQITREIRSRAVSPFSHTGTVLQRSSQVPADLLGRLLRIPHERNEEADYIPNLEHQKEGTMEMFKSETGLSNIRLQASGFDSDLPDCYSTSTNASKQDTAKISSPVEWGAPYHAIAQLYDGFPPFADTVIAPSQTGHMALLSDRTVTVGSQVLDEAE
ncbi:hypothetical protein PM082_022649 [Marasmius tenuissimus]|nr:hypothetical protein PM082_022649 [Marasmius tenuissimus]